MTVDDDEIAQAILFLMERGKMVAEGAGAPPVRRHHEPQV